MNALVFYWEFTQGFEEWIFFTYGEVPALVWQGKQLYTVVTSMFLHGDFWHILGNMVYLFVFGDNVEDRFGHGKYLLLYVVFGIGGGLLHSLLAVMVGGYDALIPAVGASAAISGILGAYLVFFPRAKIVSIVPSFIFIRVAPIPAWVFIGFWFVLQLLYIGEATAVAYVAHIGGFLIGLLVAKAIGGERPARPRGAPPTPWVSPLRLTSFCERCGERLPVHAVFCPNCGFRRRR